LISQLNPQREIPVLDDNGFLISEHIAIMQYICDKYAPETPAYPKDPALRALVNHRLCYNMAHFYSAVAPYTLAPIFFEVNLDLFSVYLQSNQRIF
jgi:glutathione S-transferase